MRAVSCLQGELSVIDLPEPQPAAGQLLIDVRRCGICGSDLHARVHADQMSDATLAVGYEGAMRADTPTVFGHEFCGEIVGPYTSPVSHRMRPVGTPNGCSPRRH